MGVAKPLSKIGRPIVLAVFERIMYLSAQYLSRVNEYPIDALRRTLVKGRPVGRNRSCSPRTRFRAGHRDAGRSRHLGVAGKNIFERAVKSARGGTNSH